jgi:hypothetical protein
MIPVIFALAYRRYGGSRSCHWVTQLRSRLTVWNNQSERVAGILNLQNLMTNLHTTAFWENWTVPHVKDIQNWNPTFPNPSDFCAVFAISFVSLLFACYLFRMVTIGHWSEYRGVWVPITVMICLFLIGLGGLVTVVEMIH